MLLKAKAEKHAGDDMTLMSLATFVFLSPFLYKKAHKMGCFGGVIGVVYKAACIDSKRGGLILL